MAIEESFGGQEDPGRPYFYKTDVRRGVDAFFIIVPVELEDRDAMNEKYGDRKRNKLTRDMDWTIPKKKQGDANKFLAARIWRDTRDTWIKLSTPEAVALYNAEIQPTEDFTIGSEVLMDGLWTETLRLDILNLKMSNWIVVQGTDAQAEADISTDEDAEKNSQSGSTSGSGTTTQLRKVSAAGAN